MAKFDVSDNENGNSGDPGGNEDAPGQTRLEKIMKERFGSPDFGTLMNGIVDGMFKIVDEDQEKK